MFSQQMHARVFSHGGESGEYQYSRNDVSTGWPVSRLCFSSYLETVKNIFHNHSRDAGANIYTIYFISSRVTNPTIPRRSSHFVELPATSFFSIYGIERARNAIIKSDCPRNIC